MPRNKEQNEAIRAEKRQLIMDTALALFAEDGYAHTSIAQIAGAAGISKGLMYTYFENKEDLLRQIILSGYEKIAVSDFREEMTIDEFLRNIETTFDQMIVYKDFFRLYLALSIQPSVSDKLAALTDTTSTGQSIARFYQSHFGKDAMKEMLLMATLSKGFSMVYLFGNNDMIEPQLLKQTVMDFMKEQFKHITK